MGSLDHIPANSALGEAWRADAYWNHGIWEQSEYNVGKVNCYSKGAAWDCEYRIYRDAEPKQLSPFNVEVEVLRSGPAPAAFLSCCTPTQANLMPAYTEQSSDKGKTPFGQRDCPLDRADETCFSPKTNRHPKDLDEQELYRDVQSSNRNAPSSLGDAKVDEVHNGKVAVDQRETGSFRGSAQVRNDHALRSSGNHTAGSLGLGGKLPATNDNSRKLKDKEITSSSKEEISNREINLKLGNPTYFEDSAVVAVAEHNSPPLLPGKKQRVSTAAQVPLCQVQGCQIDLTAAKEYHRRHKVCAAHSKSAKVIVASLEQRFCQQCSRFHILAEFDEGKRSCRRRLAGHNERRRKPQPHSFFFSSDGTSLFEGNQNAVHMTGDRHALMEQPPQAVTNAVCDSDGGNGYGKATWSRFSSFTQFVPYLSQPATNKLYMLLQPPKPTSTAPQGGDVAQFQQSLASLGNGSTHSSSCGGVGGIQGTHLSHMGTQDSPRALSLLSSHSWSSKPSSSSSSTVSLDVSPKSDLTLEQMIAENGVAFAPHISPRSSTEFQQELSQSADKCFPALPSSQENGIISPGISFAALSSTESVQSQEPFRLMQHLHSHPMLAALQGNQFADSQQTKPTIDLPTIPSPHIRHVERLYDSGLTEFTIGQYTDNQPLRFECSMFDVS